jgi:hypothetical protein
MIRCKVFADFGKDGFQVAQQSIGEHIVLWQKRGPKSLHNVILRNLL